MLLPITHRPEGWVRRFVAGEIEVVERPPVPDGWR